MKRHKMPIKCNNIPECFPYTEDLSVLSQPIQIGEKTANNRFIYQPMEGCDGTIDGSPGELTKRRYKRFAHGGPGIIWFEATAVVANGRANPRQLFINKNNIDDFSEIVYKIKNECLRSNGYEPLVFCQLTHSGRYSKPNGKIEPLVAYSNPLFIKENQTDETYILTDDELDSIKESHIVAASLAKSAGFDGADIKSCHGYLLSELLSAYTREGKYGGSFENRTRMLTDIIRESCIWCGKDFIITSRLNAYDGFIHPYGFGVNPDCGVEPCFDEVVKLSNILNNLGVNLLNITMGNPYVNPGVNRPSKTFAAYNPYDSVMRMIKGAEAVASANKNIHVVSSGLSYLNSSIANVAAACIEESKFSMAGIGRLTLAYPDYARDIINYGYPRLSQLCITCGKCTELMRSGRTPGCVIRDRDIYLPLYRELEIERRNMQ